MEMQNQQSADTVTVYREEILNMKLLIADVVMQNQRMGNTIQQLRSELESLKGTRDGQVVQNS